MPFVLRRRDLPHHPGQVGLPGGTLRESEDAWAAAIRELGEELGISPAGVVPLGAGLPLYTSVSNFSVVPFVGWFEQPDPAFTPDAHELEAVLEIPVERLLDDDQWEFSDGGWPGRYFMWEGRAVWGMTERLLADLLPRFRAALAGA